MQSTLFQPTLNHFVKWLSKKESSLSLHPSYKKNTTQSVLNESNITYHWMTSPPPDYDDKVHPWVFDIPGYLKSRKVYPREEEGNEIIPDYQCTVHKMEPMSIKCEMTSPDMKAKHRSWRRVWLEIRGTMIMAQIYCKKAKRYIVLWSHSMEEAKAVVVRDYVKYRYVIRLKLNGGPQFLLRTQSEKHSAEWITAIDSSANISTDLDKRLMPKFTTLPSRGVERGVIAIDHYQCCRQQQSPINKNIN